MRAYSLRATALSSAAYLEAADEKATAAVRHMPTNFTTVPTSFCPANDTSKSTKGGSKGEKFAERTSGGGAAGGGDDGDGSDMDAVEFVEQSRVRLYDILGDIENGNDQIKMTRKQNLERTVQGLLVAYEISERAREDDDVLDELMRVYPKQVCDPAKANPAILVINGEFNKSPGQLSIYASILQCAHDGIDDTHQPMTPEALGAALRRGIRKFYDKYNKPTERATQKAATPLNVATQSTDDLFSLVAPFRTTAFGVDRGVFQVEFTVENFMATARLINAPVVEPKWTKFEETTGGEKKQPPVGPVTATTVLPIPIAVGKDHDATVQQALFDIVSATGITSLNGAMKALNEAGIKTARGKDWYATTLKNALERWGYSGLDDFIARYTGEAAGPNGDDEPPPPAASAPVPTAPKTNTEAVGNDVKASHPTVPPAGNTNAAEIGVNTGGDGRTGDGGVANNTEPATAGHANAETARAVLLDVVDTVLAIGMDKIRVEAGENIAEFDCCDGMDKTVFIACVANSNIGIEGDIGLTEIKPLKQLLSQPLKSIDITGGESDNSTLLSLTGLGGKVWHFETTSKSSIPRARLKNPPAWTAIASFSPNSKKLVDFQKECKAYLKKNARFGARVYTKEGGHVLAFTIHGKIKSEAAMFETTKQISCGHYKWLFETFDRVIKSAKSCPIQISISADTGLMMVGFERNISGINLAYAVLIPGNLA